MWNAAGADGILPQLSPTSEESPKISDIMSQISSYVEQHFNKVITGNEPIETLKDVVTSIRKMGIDDVTKIKQQQIDRYKNR